MLNLLNTQISGSTTFLQKGVHILNTYSNLLLGIAFSVNSNNRQTRSLEQTNKKGRTSINLPREIVKGTNMSSVRLGFIYYASNKLFQANGIQGEVSDTVLSSSVFGIAVTNLTEPVAIRFPRRQERPETRQCVFWVESGKK